MYEKDRKGESKSTEPNRGRASEQECGNCNGKLTDAWKWGELHNERLRNVIKIGDAKQDGWQWNSWVVSYQ